MAGIQIAHAGRKASADLPWKGGAHLSEAQGGWETIAPSAIAFGGDLTNVPRAMTEADIARVQNDFVTTAKRALAAGFNFLELHAAHGYLFNEFLSPLSNHRTDKYGGSFENRVRFLLETTRAVRKAWPDNLPLAVRISAIDWMPGGWQIEDSIALAKLLKAEGVDLMDCSSGGVVPDAKIKVEPGYQVPFAEKVRHGADIATAAGARVVNSPRGFGAAMHAGSLQRHMLRSVLTWSRKWASLSIKSRRISPKRCFSQASSSSRTRICLPSSSTTRTPTSSSAGCIIRDII